MSTFSRELLILAAAVGAHVAVLLIRSITRRILSVRALSQTKVRTVTGFVSSAAIFVLYLAAAGFVLNELGIALTTYLAGVSVIGLAVGFGTQGVVQDVVAGLTLLFADLVDVGDLVEIGGQVGIVEKVGIRFTILRGVTGSEISIPNRTITHVVSYPRGYLSAFVDLRVPDDQAAMRRARESIVRLTSALAEQFGRLMLQPPEVAEPSRTAAGAFVRVHFSLWPGQLAVVESAIKPALARAMREFQQDYADWMVGVHYASDVDADDVKLLRRAWYRLRRREQDGRPSSESR